MASVIVQQIETTVGVDIAMKRKGRGKICSMKPQNERNNNKRIPF